MSKDKGLELVLLPPKEKKDVSSQEYIEAYAKIISVLLSVIE